MKLSPEEIERWSDELDHTYEEGKRREREKEAQGE